MAYCDERYADALATLPTQHGRTRAVPTMKYNTQTAPPSQEGLPRKVIARGFELAVSKGDAGCQVYLELLYPGIVLHGHLPTSCGTSVVNQLPIALDQILGPQGMLHRLVAIGSYPYG